MPHFSSSTPPAIKLCAFLASVCITVAEFFSFGF